MAARRIEVVNNHLKGTIQPNLTSTSKYEFTLDSGTLTKDQRDFYEQHGYILIKKLVPDHILDKCRDHFLDICNGKVDKGAMVVMKEISLLNTGLTGEKLINKVQDILNDDVFSLYTESQEILDVISSFTGPNIMGINSMIINKPPGSTPHPPHQDLYYFPFRPANRIVASWTAMEPVFVENGCLYVVPGSHKGPLYDHSHLIGKDNKYNKAFHGIVNESEAASDEKRLNLLMDKGDTVFFHPLIVHGSGPNLTNKYRKAMSCHYVSSECHYIETKGTIQEKIGNELAEIAKMKGLDVNFKNFYSHKSKVVKGECLNL